MVRSKNGAVYMNGSGVEVVADIGVAISTLYDSCYEHGISLDGAKRLINTMVNAAFEESKYNKSSDNMDDEFNIMMGGFNKALDEAENKYFRRKNVKRDL